MSHQITVSTELGDLRILGTSQALTAILWPEQTGGLTHDNPNDLLRTAAEQLLQFLQGQRTDFSLPLEPAGTPFQRAVWLQLKTIPYGATCSYGDIARELGKPDSARAVGTAIGKNPLSIVVPCHRVVGAKGQLTGFAGGLSRKQWLLQHEAG